ncbi:E3 ubiquitin-protein ligase TRIM31-like [Ochotona curzoniae]|uniref:E3 ubiquitin-protein ligase TRIM31-like n=1 Tax=Ochotona curzoniae TaxID=130825 RepID=UPI001B345977|nr:E3 ubiquitin-protein ligase TRIM31-like [Ochotona curzoniae]
MANQWVSTDLQQEMTCPICRNILQDPVTIECGHNFCQGCITQLKEGSKCPLCKSSMKKFSYKPNRLLAKLVQKIGFKRQLKEEGLRCPKHGEALHYFCEADGELLCLVCHDSKEHKSHKASLIEEAVEHHQEQIQLHVGVLEQKEQELVHMKIQVDKKTNHFMETHLTNKGKSKLIVKGCEKMFQASDKEKRIGIAILISDDVDFDLKKIKRDEEEHHTAQVDVEKQKIHSEFKHLHQVLEENKNFLLSNIEQQAQHGVKECECYNTAIQAQLNSLKDLMGCLKTKQQMPPRQLLQDIKGTLKRSEEFQVQFHSKTPIPLDLDQQFNEAKSRHDSMIKNLRKCGELLQANRKKHQSKTLQDKSATQRQSGDKTAYPASSTHHTPAQSQPRVPSKFEINSTNPEFNLPRRRASLSIVPRNAQVIDTWETGNLRRYVSNIELQQVLTPVMFDIDSAHPDLSFSQDLKMVNVIPQTHSIFPVEQQRFYPFRCVLGSPGFSTGRHTWEVELSGSEGYGAGLVGVAWEKVPRQGSLTMEPASGFWVLRITRFQCQALTGRDSWKYLPICSRRVGVSVNLEGKEVTFYDAATKDHIYTFQASFPGKIFPFFRLLFPDTQITLNP